MEVVPVTIEAIPQNARKKTIDLTELNPNDSVLSMIEEEEPEINQVFSNSFSNIEREREIFLKAALQLLQLDNKNDIIDNNNNSNNNNNELTNSIDKINIKNPNPTNSNGYHHRLSMK